VNIFVLCTGRCGSLTFAKACSCSTNFTSGHETNMFKFGPNRLAYPDQHIETDNRLSYMLGGLQQKWGNDAYYVHLMRDPEAVAASYFKRLVTFGGISRAWTEGVLMQKPRSGTKAQAMDMLRFWIEMMTCNIREFLRDKTYRTIWIEDPKADFAEFWKEAGVEGNLEAALLHFDKKYNASRRGKR